MFDNPSVPIERAALASIAAVDSVALLRQELMAARATTRQLYAHLDGAALQVPYLTTINPPLWELGHIAWFQEYWCVRGGSQPNGAASAWVDADAWFDSRVVPHTRRWTFQYPAKAQVLDYLDSSLAATLSALSSAESPYYFQLALAHEHMHAEAMRMTLATLNLPPLAALAPATPVSAPIEVKASMVNLGVAHGSTRFTFDNERPGKTAPVAAFRVASRPVTHAEFAQFVADGGYQRADLWSAEAWRVVGQHGSAAQVHEFWQARRWQQRWQLGDPDTAATHLSAYEAEAYARWCGGRLPTEAEWQAAYQSSPEFVASTGAVWEWLADDFLPFEGFTPDPYAEYSAPWFGTHRLLKGGSAWTHPHLKYPQYRNFYTPERTDVLSGARVVWD